MYLNLKDNIDHQNSTPVIQSDREEHSRDGKDKQVILKYENEITTLKDQMKEMLDQLKDVQKQLTQQTNKDIQQLKQEERKVIKETKENLNKPSPMRRSTITNSPRKFSIKNSQQKFKELFKPLKFQKRKLKLKEVNLLQ